MRSCKAKKFELQWNSGLTDFIDIMEKQQVIRSRNKYTLRCNKRGGTLVSSKNQKGNRFKRTLPDSWYLSTSFFSTKHPGVSRQTQRHMRVTTSLAIMTLQMKILARVAMRAKTHAPLCTMTRFKWDEASHVFRLRVANGKSYDGTWSVMVGRLKIAVQFSDGRRIAMSIIMPPTLIKGLKAVDMHHQHTSHPVYKATWQAISVIEAYSQINMRLNGVSRH